MRKDVRAVLVGVVSALATFGLLESKHIVVGFQIFGSQNTQTIASQHHSPPTDISASKPTPPVAEKEASLFNALVEQQPKDVGKQSKRHTPRVDVEEESDCYYVEEDDTDSEEEEEEEIEEPPASRRFL